MIDPGKMNRGSEVDGAFVVNNEMKEFLDREYREGMESIKKENGRVSEKEMDDLDVDSL